MASFSRITSVHDVVNVIDMVNNYRLDPKANCGKTEHNNKGLSVQCRLTTRWGYETEAPTKDKRRIATFDTGVEYSRCLTYPPAISNSKCQLQTREPQGSNQSGL